jgi:hypothetical protein
MVIFAMDAICQADVLVTVILDLSMLGVAPSLTAVIAAAVLGVNMVIIFNFPAIINVAVFVIDLDVSVNVIGELSRALLTTAIVSSTGATPRSISALVCPTTSKVTARAKNVFMFVVVVVCCFSILWEHVETQKSEVARQRDHYPKFGSASVVRRVKIQLITYGSYLIWRSCEN